MFNNEYVNCNTESVVGEVLVKENMEKVGVFIPFPNVARAFGTPYYLTDFEVTTLVAIQHHVWAWDNSIAHVNVELLHAWLGSETKNASRTKKEIVKAIHSLKDKGYISFDVEDEIKNNTLLTVRIPLADDELMNMKIKCDGSIFTGFTKLDKKMIQIAKLSSGSKIGQRIKVLTHIKWRNEIEYSISFEEWSKVLDVVKSTAVTLLRAMADNEGVIEIVSGSFVRDEEGIVIQDKDGRPRQEMNTYYLAGERPSKEQAEYKTTQTKKHRRVQKVSKLISQIMSEGEVRIQENPSLILFGKNLSVTDIAIYITTDSKTLIEESQSRLKQIASNVKGKEMLLDWEKKALEQVEVSQVKRSITNIIDVEDVTELDEARQEIIGGLDEDETDYDFEINSEEEMEVIMDSVEVVEEKQDLFNSPAWLERKRRLLEMED